MLQRHFRILCWYSEIVSKVEDIWSELFLLKRPTQYDGRQYRIDRLPIIFDSFRDLSVNCCTCVFLQSVFQMLQYVR